MFTTKKYRAKSEENYELIKGSDDPSVWARGGRHPLRD
jgi:hypothetical protein